MLPKYINTRSHQTGGHKKENKGQFVVQDFTTWSDSITRKAVARLACTAIRLALVIKVPRTVLMPKDSHFPIGQAGFWKTPINPTG